MTIHLLVEGPAERALLERWVPRLLKTGEVRVHPHQGKGALPHDLGAAPDPKRRGLLDLLPATLRGFAGAAHAGAHRILVLVDADNDNADALLASITEAATEVAPHLPVTVRMAVEETEAFYLGDLSGMSRAFPDADMKRARAYEPDSIVGTWELFGAIVGDGGGNKVAWAEAMGPVLTTRPGHSRSPSFKELVRGLRELLPAPLPPKPRRRSYRHPRKPTRKPDRRR